MMNYRQRFAIRKQREQQIKELCLGIQDKSGIYIFYRIDENGFKFCYCGQAVRLIQRILDHFEEYDRIGLSLKKRKLFSDTNKFGWNIYYYYTNNLDEEEQLTIKKFADAGYQLYNKTGGGQKSKSNLVEGKSPKGYYDGIKQGCKNTKKEVKTYFDKYLDYTIKGKPTKIKERKLKEFKEFLGGTDNEIK